MQPDFWHDRWNRQQIGFHEPAPNPLLLDHVDALGLSRGARVFVPLCGKTLDIDWLLERGHAVAGTELSPIAITALFDRLRLTPVIEPAGELQRWHAGALQVFVGDHFRLQPSDLGRVDAVYDRAALIAMPPQMRPEYGRQMLRLAGHAPQLLVTLEYPQAELNGPPFSVPAAELPTLYPSHRRERLSVHAIEGGLKGKVPACEVVWKLLP